MKYGMQTLILFRVKYYVDDIFHDTLFVSESLLMLISDLHAMHGMRIDIKEVEKREVVFMIEKKV